MVTGSLEEVKTKKRLFSATHLSSEAVLLQTYCTHFGHDAMKQKEKYIR